ncbi:hypothetical protein [uncultured Methanoregula sp.]|uniref:hypothetical protein n=1 Tax=uncultured Methanoregula sp. TaxID=1005933 RepID=UPI002AABBCD6|nr:hypothetical protein [uncultured Methanoregula sp.]
MIYGFYKKVISLVKTLVKSAGTRLIFLVHFIKAVTPEQRPDMKSFLASGIMSERIKGSRGRLEGGHAPVFSLFTYFRDRQ